MATTTATITLASADIADNNFSVSNTATLYTAGTNTGITETTGLSRKKFATTAEFKLLDFGLAGSQMADVTANKSCKVYIKNINDIGRLYGGDWMFFPWKGGDDKDIDINAYDATETTLEYTVFYE